MGDGWGAVVSEHDPQDGRLQGSLESRIRLPVKPGRGWAEPGVMDAHVLCPERARSIFSFLAGCPGSYHGSQ